MDFISINCKGVNINKFAYTVDISVDIYLKELIILSISVCL